MACCCCLSIQQLWITLIKYINSMITFLLLKTNLTLALQAFTAHLELKFLLLTFPAFFLSSFHFVCFDASISMSPLKWRGKKMLVGMVTSTTHTLTLIFKLTSIEFKFKFKFKFKRRVLT